MTDAVDHADVDIRIALRPLGLDVVEVPGHAIIGADVRVTRVGLVAAIGEIDVEQLLRRWRVR